MNCAVIDCVCLGPDSGKSWTDGPTGGPTGAKIVANVTAPPIDCSFTAYGPAFNCSELTWSVDGLTSILPLRDGKTILLFGVAHNGDPPSTPFFACLFITSTAFVCA